MPLNEYLGSLLRVYITLLMEALRLHNRLIDNSMFPLLTSSPGDAGVGIKSRIRKRLLDSHTLQSQMRTFKEVGDDLITLGLLPPAWPNHGEEWGTRAGDAPGRTSRLTET